MTKDKKENKDDGIYFDYKKLQEHKSKIPIIVIEKNKLNIERAAQAFYDLLRK